MLAPQLAQGCLLRALTQSCTRCEMRSDLKNGTLDSVMFPKSARRHVWMLNLLMTVGKRKLRYDPDSGRILCDISTKGIWFERPCIAGCSMKSVSRQPWRELAAPRLPSFDFHMLLSTSVFDKFYPIIVTISCFTELQEIQRPSNITPGLQQDNIRKLHLSNGRNTSR